MSQRVVLISCCGAKLDHPAPARELYRSQWFKAALRYATADPRTQVFILSAKLGLVELDEIIEPYDFTLRTQSRDYRAAWAKRVATQLTATLEDEDMIEILAGRAYRDDLMAELIERSQQGRSRSWSITVPMAGLGIGQQLGWLKTEAEYDRTHADLARTDPLGLTGWRD